MNKKKFGFLENYFYLCNKKQGNKICEILKINKNGKIYYQT